jgi:hypothetical protein
MCCRSTARGAQAVSNSSNKHEVVLLVLVHAKGDLVSIVQRYYHVEREFDLCASALLIVYIKAWYIRIINQYSETSARTFVETASCIRINIRLLLLQLQLMTHSLDILLNLMP